MTEIQRQRLEKVLEYRGIEKQRRLLQEECAELIQAVSKLERYGAMPERVYNFVEELADVSIMIEQMKMTFSMTEKAWFAKITDEKIIREIDRITKERGNVS